MSGMCWTNTDAHHRHSLLLLVSLSFLSYTVPCFFLILSTSLMHTLFFHPRICALQTWLCVDINTCLTHLLSILISLIANFSICVLSVILAGHRLRLVTRGHTSDTLRDTNVDIRCISSLIETLSYS